MDTEIRDLTSTERTLATCPTFVTDVDGLPVECGAPLEIVATTTIVGDDYGSWPVFDVYLRCGHTLDDMRSSLRHADEI